MAFHQDKTLKNPKVQSRSTRRRPTKKSKGPKPKFETTPYKKRKRIPKSKVEVEANLQKKEKEIQSKVEVEANLQKKNKSKVERTEARDPKSKPTERT